ncbi:hypothetical protein ACFGVS_30830 [Mucilaginibacter sp. AW1-7]
MFVLPGPGKMIKVPKGHVLAGNRHQYLDEPKSRDEFSVNHD